jgi:uncharacterized protein (TIGR00251 family)
LSEKEEITVKTMKIKVKVKPNARENSVKKIEDGYYELKVSMAPQKGKANEQVIKLLSLYFDKPKSSINIIKGHTNKEKVIVIE